MEQFCWDIFPAIISFQTSPPPSTSWRWPTTTASPRTAEGAARSHPRAARRPTRRTLRATPRRRGTGRRAPAPPRPAPSSAFTTDSRAPGTSPWSRSRIVSRRRKRWMEGRGRWALWRCSPERGTAMRPLQKGCWSRQRRKWGFLYIYKS